MKLLAIETSGKYGSASVIDEDGRISSASSEAEMNHLQGMIGLIDSVIRDAGTDRRELTHIAASVGPGSFTGIRIGVTTARVMAQMLGIPCIGVSSLEALAEGAMGGAHSASARMIVPIINARRHQTYAGAWLIDSIDSDEPRIVPALEQKQYMIEELMDALKERMQDMPDAPQFFFTGDGIDAYEDIIAENLAAGSYALADESIRYQMSDAVAVIASLKAERGEVCTYNELLPEYMRLAEAEQRLRAGTLSDRIRRPVG